MDGLSILDPVAWDPAAIKLHPAYLAGNTAAWFTKAGAAGTNHYLAGRLYVSKSGWLLLSVPNALVRGVFDAMNTPGAELPLAGAMNVPDVKPDLLNAHISVMTADEVAQIGKDRINERGHTFHYALGPVKEITPKNISGISRVWAIQVASPELTALRKSYGLTPLLHGDHQFHITVAVRRAKVLGNNNVGKFDTATGRGELKAAAAENLPWRERAEVYARDPATGKLYGGKWDNDGSFALPGGGIDPGEDPAAAALRELKEETGIHATNARVLPVPPVDSPWSDKTRAEKAKQGRGNFAGTRTHFVAADIVKHPKGRRLDYWAATDRGYYDPAEALAIMQSVKKFNVPSIASARMAAINHLIAEAAKKQAAVKDVLPGGSADHVTDNKFSPEALAEGKKHEREHTNSPEIAKEIAKDHLSEDPAYYKKVEKLEKAAKSVYLDQARQALDPTMPYRPIPYDPTKPVFENIKDQLTEAKRRGDFINQSAQNHRIWRAQLDPHYRHRLALDAIHGRTAQQPLIDRIIAVHGDGILNQIPTRRGI